jgi:hypothetical protein
MKSMSLLAIEVTRKQWLKSARGRGTLEKEKPPIFGMIQRNGDVVIQMLPNVRQKTIEPLIKHSVLPGQFALYR